jgi:hypothetical protein
MATYGETTSATMASQRLGDGGAGAGTYEQWKSALYAGRRTGAGGDGFGTYGQWQSRETWLSSPAVANFAQAQLYMDFTNNAARQGGTWSSAVPLLTTTRASVAQMDNSGGFWGQFAANAPRWSDKGMWVEATKTNSIRNNTMVGAVAGSPGTVPTNWVVPTTGAGLTRTVVNVGNENGIDYIDLRLQTVGAFTTNISFEGTTQVAAVATNVFALSHFCSIVAGSLTNITCRTVISERAAGGASSGGLSNPIFTPATGVMQRISVVRTLTDGTCAFVQPRLDVIATGDSDITLRIGWPQLEQGGFASSPIKTSTIAVTRAGDFIDMVGLTPDPAQGTLFAEYLIPYDSTIAENKGVVGLDDGTVNNRLFMYQSTGADQAVANGTSASVAGLVVLSQILSYGTVTKIASACAVNELRAAFNGVSGTADLVGAFPVGIANMRLGRISSGGFQLDGYLRRLAYWPTRLTDAQLQAITA